MYRTTGFKLGLVLIIIGLALLSQTTLKSFIPALSLSNYISGFVMPVTIFWLNVEITAWIIFALGVLSFVLAVFDLPPFNY